MNELETDQVTFAKRACRQIWRLTRFYLLDKLILTELVLCAISVVGVIIAVSLDDKK